MQLHAYTITNAIEDEQRPSLSISTITRLKARSLTPRASDPLTQRKAIVNSILDKHDAATNEPQVQRPSRHLSRSTRPSSIIGLFKAIQAERLAAEPGFQPLNVACVFSPPANGNADIRQIQEDLPTEKADNAVEPEKKKAALASIIADYNARYGTNHDLNNFDLYYQDLQKRIKDQQYPNRDLGREEKVDLVIVVDMLLTGFDSKYLNTLYVDKRLKHHGLIQAFSRTNRVLNATKPFGSILDFRAQDKEVDEAIALFSGEEAKRAKEIWLVDPAPVVITKLKAAVGKLDTFMSSQGLPCAPGEVANLKGDEARAQFINLFKEVQHLRTQLDQYTDLSDKDRKAIEKAMPEDTHQAFRGVYLETAQRLKAQKGGGEEGEDAAKELDFEFVLFASALIDYDYIMGPHRDVHSRSAHEAVHEPRGAHRPHRRGREVHGRQGGHSGLHQDPQGRQPLERGGDQGRLQGLQGAKGRGGAHGHGGEARHRGSFSRGLRRWHHVAHDLRRRRFERALRSPRALLEGEDKKGACPHGGTHAPTS